MKAENNMRNLTTTFSRIEDVFHIDMEILKGKSCKINDDYIELENGELLHSMRDGRYIDENNNQWEALLLQEYDDEGEPCSGDLIGYIKIQ